MIAEPDIPNSKKPVIPDSDRESSDIACELIPAFAGMTNVGNECIDAVGNVLALYNANSSGRGNELYYFTQDAFGNELTTSPFSGTAWSTARTIGITEHQTGKWIDPFTGLYFFHARWYDSGVGRFVGRANLGSYIEHPYSISDNSPICISDPTGNCPGCPPMDKATIQTCPNNCNFQKNHQIDWLDCLIKNFLKLSYEGHSTDKVKIQFCARPLTTSDAYQKNQPTSLDCWACHGYIKICDIDVGIFDDSTIKFGEERFQKPVCYSCFVKLSDFIRILNSIMHKWINPPYYGPGGGISAASPWTNCQEWAEQTVEDLGIDFCNYPWSDTFNGPGIGR